MLRKITKLLARLLVLYPLTGIYWMVMFIRNILFNTRILRITRVKPKVIAIGNLSVGGTGKTIMAEFLLQYMSDRGYKSAYLSRGYGRKTKGYLLVDPDNHSFDDVGDEALQVASKFKNCRVAVCENRVTGANRLYEDYQVDVVILDDAFQHRKIHRDLNILMIDYNRLPWDDRVLPIGRLRESVWSIRRADIIVVTKIPKEKDAKKLSSQFHGKRYHKKMVFTGLEPEAFYRIADEPSPQPVAKFAQVGAVLFCGLGNNKHFIQFCRHSGVFPMRNYQFGDHQKYRPKDLLRVTRRLDIVSRDTYLKSAPIIITSEKDYFRLKREEWFPDMYEEYPFYYLSVHLKFLRKKEVFQRILGEKLPRKNERSTV